LSEILLRKALAARDRIARLRHALPRAPEDVLGDERLEAYLAFHLFLLVQDVVDLATHLVAAKGLTVPGSQREVFEALAKAGLISGALADDMGALASLRNRIAHAYGDLDPRRMVAEMPTGLAHVERLLDELAEAITQT